MSPVRVSRAEVHRRDRQLAEPAYVGPALLGMHRYRQGLDKRPRRRQVQPRPCAFGGVGELHGIRLEQLTHMSQCLAARLVRGEAVVDRDHALVGDDVAGDPAPDADGAQRLAVLEPVHPMVCGSYATNRPRIVIASWIALWPFQGRAEWAALPLAVTSTRRVPLQPPSMLPPVGSSSTAKSACSSSGLLRPTRARPLRWFSISSQS